MPSELRSGVTRRLHPMSWLFVLLQQLRQFAVPLIALLVFGRGERWELLGGVAALVLAGSAVVRYLTYRFGVHGDELIVRQGVFRRNVRHIPLARIHNVSLERNPLHRLFGVAEVRLESAGGATTEAQMRVLSLRDAQALERLIRAGAQASTDDDAPAPSRTLLHLSTGELLRLGLISNRGTLVLGAAIGLMAQYGQENFGSLVKQAGQWLFGQASALQLGLWQTVAAGLVLLLLALLLLRLFSIAVAVLLYHDFRLSESEGRLSVEAGLLTRVRANVPWHRIQLWSVHESLLHRWFGRRSLRVETAASVSKDERSRNLNQLAPVATPAHLDALLAELVPQARWPDFDWQPLHARAWRRMAFKPVLLTVLACAVLAFGWLGGWAWLGLLLLPWWVLAARRNAQRSGFALNDAVIAYRSGWLDRHVSFAEVTRLQAVQLRCSPFDRRRGMAGLVLDTAGASPWGHRLHLRYLPEAVARALADELGGRIGRSPLAW